MFMVWGQTTGPDQVRFVSAIMTMWCPPQTGDPSVDHPKPNLLSETNSGALGTGHLHLAVVEDIPAGGLVRGQIVRFYNLNPADVCSNVFRIDFNKGGNVYKLENQIVRDFVRSQQINRIDQHKDLCHDGKVYQEGEILPAEIVGFCEGVTAANGQNYRVTQLRFR